MKRSVFGTFAGPLAGMLTGLMAGCTNNQAEAVAPTSTFTGTVLLQDEYGRPMRDNSGALVSLYDDPSVSTLTAADGSFSLPNVAMGPHRLKIQKGTAALGYFGSYYSDPISATGPTYQLARPVRLGKLSYARFDVRYSVNSTKQYLLVQGTRTDPGATDTQLLSHRVVFNFTMSDIYAYPQTSKHSIGFRNNLPGGFSDTIRFSTLAAANLGHGLFVGVCNNNPSADSCAIPISIANSTGNGGSQPQFRQTCPALYGVGAGGDCLPTTLVW